jgi:hypothetical protein
MTPTTKIQTRRFGLTPIAACVAIAFSGSGFAMHPVDAVRNTAHMRHVMQRAAHRPVTSLPAIVAGTDTVTVCDDGADPGTLRNIIAAATSGDTIDLSACVNSTITLASEIAITQAALTLQGPTPAVSGPTVTISGGHNGRVFNSSGDLTIDSLAIVDGQLENDGASAVGGCVYAFESAVVSNSTISGCAAIGAYVYGAGIAAGALTLANTTVSNNVGTANSTAAGETGIQVSGGGALSFSDATVTNSKITGNTAVIGTVIDPTVTTFYATFGGGIGSNAFANANISMTITGSVISGNSADNGAGINVQGTGYASNLTVDTTTIDQNTAASVGGGVNAEYYGTLTFTRSTISANTAADFNGGIGSLFSTAVIVQNSTISGNSAAKSAGIGAFAYDITFQNSTIAFNTGTSCAGACIYGATSMTVDSTIISNNIATDTSLHAADFGVYGTGPYTVDGNNSLITSSDAGAVFTNAPLTGDPKLLPLADNHGPTQTHALDILSPAIDAGNNNAVLATDQRGVPRTVGLGTDIGAFEVFDDDIFADGFDGP